MNEIKKMLKKHRNCNYVIENDLFVYVQYNVATFF